MVEIGHLPSCPRIEIRRPCISSSQTLSTVPALPSVRITALPTSSVCACSNAPRIVNAVSFTVGMGDPGLNASVFASERRTNRDRLAANGCPVEPALYANLETWGGTEMPVMQERAIRAARVHDQAGRNAGDRA